MKFNFKKVASVLASVVMLSSTIGFAAAASYPAPFVAGGTASGAVVVGVNAAVSDWSAAIDLQQNLNGLVTSSSGGGDSTITGEAIGLFTSGTKIYVNDTINVVKNVLTKSDLPTVLASGSFSGNVDATITQTIDIGFNPRIVFDKMPTNSEDPEYGLSISTTDSQYIYNATATFSKAVNFTHADSEGETLGLFGQTFTIGSGTDATSLVLLKSAEKISLDTDNPSAEVTIGTETYTIELVSASDTSATIQVTDSAGNTNSKEITEADSKKVGDITIAVTNADETNLKLSASIVAGAEKVTLTSGSAITYGESDTVIDGTLVSFTGGTGAMTKLSISVSATSSDSDALKAGESFTDPVFGTFKVDFAGFNIEEDSTAREEIKVQNSGDDKMQVTFTDYNGNEGTVQFAYNFTTGFELMHNDDYKNITVAEGGDVKYQDYVVVGNEDEAYLLELYQAVNSSTAGFANDHVKFRNVFDSTDTYEAVWSDDTGSGTITIGGKAYTVKMIGTSDNETTDYIVRLGYPDSATGRMIVYPTIQTSKGAKIAFYEPLTINVDSFDSDGTNLTAVMLPDGDGYETLTFTNNGAFMYNITDGDGATVKQIMLNGTAEAGVITQSFSIGDALNYSFTTTTSAGVFTLKLNTPEASLISGPALVIFEEKDDNSQYQAMIVELENGHGSDDGMGVNDVWRTWSTDSSAWEKTLASDSKMTKEADLWGSLTLLDSSDSDQKTAAISYPDDQIYAQIYIAENSAAITPGTVSGGSGGQILIVKDTQVSSVSGKNLVVVGGSCINTVAAKILGSDVPLCDAEFTDKTGVGAGQYIIKTVASPYAAADSGKVAMLVAGYDAADTVNAVAKAMEGATSDVDTEQVYPITGTA